jgi:hypothetical protein
MMHEERRQLQAATDSSLTDMFLQGLARQDAQEAAAA